MTRQYFDPRCATFAHGALHGRVTVRLARRADGAPIAVTRDVPMAHVGQVVAGLRGLFPAADYALTTEVTA
jgi:hypothetical protein